MVIQKIKNFWKSLQNKSMSSTTAPSYQKYNHPTFDIESAYAKLYDVTIYDIDSDKTVVLTAHEASELLEYIQYMSWLTNPPEDIEWYHRLQARMNERY